MIEDDLRTVVKNLNAIRQIAGGRVYHAQAPAGLDKYPCVVYRLSSRDKIKCLMGTAGLQAPEYQLDCIAASSSDALRMAEAISSLTGECGVGKIQWIWQQDDNELLEPPISMEERGMLTESVVLRLWGDL